jgi:hypothetical protein
VVRKIGALSFRQKQPDLKNDEWAVYTPDENIQEGISSFMAERGEGSCIAGEITYNGNKRPVFFVPFYVVEFLKKNKSRFPEYISFHRKPRAGASGSGSEYGLWRVWMEGSKTPNAFLKKIFENWGKN